MKKLIASLLITGGVIVTASGQVNWVYVSSKTGAIEVPNTGKQQTSAAVADFDNDGDLDILGKPYDGDAPRLDIWLQNGSGIISSEKK